MFAAIDIGSNTLRMILGSNTKQGDCRHQYYREIARLSGNFCSENGLHPDSMQRALFALKGFCEIAQRQNVQKVRAVATEAVRRASNRDVFLDMIKVETGLSVEVIDGIREAELTTLGVLSVIDPLPQKTIVMDIGGGSTELICLHGRTVLFQKSYPLGVVRLCEEARNDTERLENIDGVFNDFRQQLSALQLYSSDYTLVGTAGSVTTLAAMQLGLKTYDQAKINNHVLPLSWLEGIYSELLPLTIPEREKIFGMEEGRGDLILHGISIIFGLCQTMQCSSLKISDSGLLEGLYRGMCSDANIIDGESARC